MGQQAPYNHGINWQHIHGRGAEATIVDMCMKQAKGNNIQSFHFQLVLLTTVLLGLGMFLHSIDPSRSWSDHLMHILIFCRVHIQRTLYQSFRDAPEYSLMCQLLTETNKTKFDVILRQLINSSNPNVRHYARNKNVDWILAGMSRCYTKMPAVSFDSYEKNSNLVESTHRSTNLSGVGVSLLAGIKEYVMFLS
jgi:hypothetical protein